LRRIADGEPVISIEGVYGKEHALRVLQAALEDYDEEYGR
jgi:hypothetical protein